MQELSLCDCKKQGTSEAGFEPAYAGYEPTAIPLSYSGLLWVPFKTQFSDSCGSLARSGRVSAGCSQSELTDPEKIAVCVFLSRCRYGGAIGSDPRLGSSLPCQGRKRGSNLRIAVGIFHQAQPRTHRDSNPARLHPI